LADAAQVNGGTPPGDQRIAGLAPVPESTAPRPKIAAQWQTAGYRLRGAPQGVTRPASPPIAKLHSSRLVARPRPSCLEGRRWQDSGLWESRECESMHSSWLFDNRIGTCRLPGTRPREKRRRLSRPRWALCYNPSTSLLMISRWISELPPKMV
jgi:hypothetical protein